MTRQVGWVSVVLVAFLSIGLASCGGGERDDRGSGGTSRISQPGELAGKDEGGGEGTGSASGCDRRSGTRQRLEDVSGAVAETPALSSDGSRLIYTTSYGMDGGSDMAGDTEFWNLMEVDLNRTRSDDSVDGVSSAPVAELPSSALSGDGSTLVYLTGEFHGPDIQVVQPDGTGRSITDSLPDGYRDSTNTDMISVSLADDGRLLGLSTGERGAIVWDLATNKQVNSLVQESDMDWAQLSIKMAGGGRYMLISGNRDEDDPLALWQWDLRSGAVVKVPTGDLEVWHSEISADGKTVAFVGQDGAKYRVYLWSGGEGAKPITPAMNEADTPGTLAVHAVTDDGSAVLIESPATDLVPGDTNDQSDLFLWTSNTNGFLRVSEGHGSTGGASPAAFAASMSGDGCRIAYVTSDLTQEGEVEPNGFILWTADR